MDVQTLKTHPVQVGDSITGILDTYIPPLEEGTIVVLTSKIISLCQGRVVAKAKGVEKETLIRQEAEGFLEVANKYNICLTLKHNRLIPSAGIDESNGGGLYILYPQDIQGTAASLWRYLQDKHSLTKLGILITDSTTAPLRRGVVGIGLGWCGFDPLYSYIGQPDIFGKDLRVTQINNLDALAAAAVYVMGEGAEQTPLSLITDVPRIRFTQEPPTEAQIKELAIPLEEDLYAPLLKGAPWVWQED